MRFVACINFGFITLLSSTKHYNDKEMQISKKRCRVRVEYKFGRTSVFVPLFAYINQPFAVFLKFLNSSECVDPFS